VFQPIVSRERSSNVGVTIVAPTLKSIETFKELSHRLDQIVGVPFAELGEFYHHPWSGSAAHNKGWAGRLVDRMVGGDVSNAPEPDISSLGIEVKSIPIGKGARVLEPTKVTMLNYSDLFDTSWPDSTVYHKLRAVLFVPVVKFNPTRPDEWYIRRPFLWLPSKSTLDQLKADYDSVREVVTSRDFDRISSARPPKGQGDHLHPKPSAANASVRAKYVIDGTEYRLLPRAWMLRESFTQPIVTQSLKVDLKLSEAGIPHSTRK
jgi:DNA mismatch repair protein MutH